MNDRVEQSHLAALHAELVDQDHAKRQAIRAELAHLDAHGWHEAWSAFALTGAE